MSPTYQQLAAENAARRRRPRNPRPTGRPRRLHRTVEVPAPDACPYGAKPEDSGRVVEQHQTDLPPVAAVNTCFRPANDRHFRFAPPAVSLIPDLDAKGRPSRTERGTAVALTFYETAGAEPLGSAAFAACGPPLTVR